MPVSGIVCAGESSGIGPKAIGSRVGAALMSSISTVNVRENSSKPWSITVTVTVTIPVLLGTGLSNLVCRLLLAKKTGLNVGRGSRLSFEDDTLMLMFWVSSGPGEIPVIWTA